MQINFLKILRFRKKDPTKNNYNNVENKVNLHHFESCIIMLKYILKQLNGCS